MTAQPSPREQMARNVSNLNTGTTIAREMVAGMLDVNTQVAGEAAERLLAFMRGLSEFDREQMTMNALTMLVQVQRSAEDRRRNG